MAITVECKGLTTRKQPWSRRVKCQHSLFGDIYTLVLQLYLLKQDGAFKQPGWLNSP